MTAVPAECDLNQFDAAHETIAVLLPWYTRMVVVWIEQLPARLLASQNEGKGTQNAHANIRLGGMASPRNQQLHDAAVIPFLRTIESAMQSSMNRNLQGPFCHDYNHHQACRITSTIEEINCAFPRRTSFYLHGKILFSHPPKECIAAKNHNFSVVNQSGGLLGKDHEVRKRCFYGRRIKALLFHLRFL